MRQTPYERKLTGFSPGDTKILLGQSDFHETLKRPAVRKFASIRQPAAEAEQQPERSGSSGHVNKTWDKIRSWSKNTFSRGKSGECSATDGEKSRAGGCEPDQNGQGSEQGRGTGSQEQLTDFRVLHCKRAKAAHSG
ncbi:hypothetical protein, conserved [Eimeria necatrix]|uniref:Uncharacterized protein n=1 Tax=Eimeria necatrix TaxID=51315 RepID=U6N5H3_9EIME|nr:hypothetical protein, conserved [Eimeria necatrix]CDJ69970.1 hypothetical protein, conserved [Eimeria necatrix]